MTIVIVGLGPGESRMLTREAWETLVAAEVIYCRTRRHPVMAELPASVRQISFDEVYDQAADFEEVYRTIVERLLALGQAAQQRGGRIVYAVPGHPMVGEATVERLCQMAASAGVAVQVIPGLSFVEPVLTAVGLDALDGLQIVDAAEVAARHYPPVNPDRPALFAQVYSRLLAGELKLALMGCYPADHEVALVHAAGTAQEVVERRPLHEIDHSDQIAHLTSLYVPPLPYVSSLAGLAETVAHLRSPEGCPWDQEQTPQSLRTDFQEEASEALDALDAGDAPALREELGDLLYHIVIQAIMAAETEEFTLTEVIAGVDAKLKRRHPHVWGDWQVSNSAEAVRNWEKLKEREKGAGGEAASLLDNVPNSLPALARAQKIQRRVKTAGFDWPAVEGVIDKVMEELAELRVAKSQARREAELGDVLFAVVNWARWLNLDAEAALRIANSRFERRFRKLEMLARSRGQQLTEMSLAALDRLWEEAKATAPSSVE